LLRKNSSIDPKKASDKEYDTNRESQLDVDESAFKTPEKTMS